MRYFLYTVCWNDTESKTVWSKKKKVKSWAKKSCGITETGYIVYETGTHLVLSSQIADDGDIGNRSKIPKKAIISMVKRRGCDIIVE